MIGLERLVQPAPPNLLRGGGLPRDELVVRAAPRVRRGDGAERSALGDHALAAPHRVLVELGRPQVPMDRALWREARGVQGGGPPFAGAGGVRGHARARRPGSCAATAAVTARFTRSF